MVLSALFFVSDGEIRSFLADGVLSGVKPPAGNFSRQRKVTKSWLRTYGSKDSYPDVER